MEDVLFCGLNLGAWITIVTVLSMFLTLIFTKLREEVAFLGVIAVLLLTGVLDTKEALGGFSSGSVVVIGVLFAVVAGLVHTGVMQWIVRYLLGTPKSYSGADVARGWTQFGVEQHNSGGAVCKHREDVGEEIEHRTFETAHPIELRFRNGWCVYAHRYASQPHHIGALRH